MHHGSTRRVAEVLARELDATILAPAEVTATTLAGYDRIGFGSGIYNRKHHQSLFALVATLEPQAGKVAFLFSTTTLPVKSTHKELQHALTEKGFVVCGEFQCRGKMTYSFTKFFFGGFNKKRPNVKDLEQARLFACGLK